MEGQNHLGIYLGKNAATVVCLGPDGGVVGSFGVSVEDGEQQGFQVLADLIAGGCVERALKFSEVAIAIDCAMFMQHNVSSEFKDSKQIAATIQFDTEEALATDISDVAIAFKATSSDDNGSAVSVFTAKQKMLSQIILAFQNNNIDPVSVEPDISCLSRFICRGQSPQAGTFFAVLSAGNGYFINFIESQQWPTVRTFLIGPGQDRSQLLGREVPLTAALTHTAGPISQLQVFDSEGSIDCAQLSEKLGIETVEASLEAGGSDSMGEDVGRVDFAIAYGAALFGSEKTASLNFRNDFMPYQGRKLRLEKAVKLLSISLVVLLLAMSVFLQVRLFQKSRPVRQLRAKFNEQYSAVMFGKSPPTRTSPVKKLTGELRRVQNVKSGQLSATGEKSIIAKLTMVLNAFNDCAKQTKLKTQKISITSKSITIVGDTYSMKNYRNYRKLVDSLKKNGLQKVQDNISSKGGRDIFSITVVPKK